VPNAPAEPLAPAVPTPLDSAHAEAPPEPPVRPDARSLLDEVEAVDSPRNAAARSRAEGSRSESAPNQAHGSDLDMGSDLRAIRRGGRLRIDVEDPYQ